MAASSWSETPPVESGSPEWTIASTPRTRSLVEGSSPRPDCTKPSGPAIDARSVVTTSWLGASDAARAWDSWVAADVTRIFMYTRYCSANRFHSASLPQPLACPRSFPASRSALGLYLLRARHRLNPVHHQRCPTPACRRGKILLPAPGRDRRALGVGEGLLHDPVCGEVEACRELVRLPRHVHLHRQARVGELLGKPIDLPGPAAGRTAPPRLPPAMSPSKLTIVAVSLHK